MNSSPLRILQVLHDYPPSARGGTEMSCLRSALELKARGHEVIVACGDLQAAERSGIRREEVEGIPVLRIQRAHLFLDHWDKSHAPEVEELFFRVLREVEPDIVHVHHWIRLTRTLVACAHEAEIPAVVTLHDLWSSCPRCFRVRDESFCELPQGPESCRDCVASPAFYEAGEVDVELARYREDLDTELDLARRVIVPSEAHRAAIARFTALPAERMTRLAHGTLADGLEPAERRLGDDDLLRLGHWGNLHPLKGPHLLLEAARGLDSAERGRLEIHLFGETADQAYEARLRELSRGLRVVRHGAFRPEDLQQQSLDWAVIPSLASESWSFVLDEAFALGLPVIASRRGALEERIADAGLLFEPGSSADLERCLRRILAEPTLRERCLSARPALPSMAEHAEALEGLYREVLSESSPLPLPSPEVVSRRNAWSAQRLEIRYRQILSIRDRLSGEHDRIARLEDQLALASASVADAKRSVRDHSLSIALHRDELVRHKEELASLREHAGAVEVERDAVRQELGGERERASSLENSLQRVRAEREDLVSRQEALTRELNLLLESRREEGRRTEEREHELRTLREELATLASEEERLRGVETELVEAAAAIEASTRREAELSERIRASEAQLEAALSAQREVERERSRLSDEAETLRTEVERRARRAREAEAELEGFRSELPELREGLRELEEQRVRGGQLSSELEAARDRLDQLEERQRMAEESERELEIHRSTLTRLEAALGEAAPRGEEPLPVWGEQLSKAVEGMRLQMEELAGELERVRVERDAHLAGREGAEARLQLSDRAFAELDGKWWARALGLGGERERLRRSGGSLRILLVIHQFLPRHAAGSEVYTYNLAKELSKRHDVELLFTEAHYGVPQYRVRRGVYDGLPFTEIVHQHAIHSFPRSYQDPRMEALFERVLERFRPDVVHLQHLHYFSIGCIDRVKARGIPLLYTLHEYMLLCPRHGRMRREDGERCEVPEASKCGECIRHQELDPAVDDGLQPRLWQRAARFVPPEARRFLKSLLPPPQPTPIPEERSLEAHRAAAGERLEIVQEALRKVDLLVAPSRFLRDRFLAAGMTTEEHIVYSDYGMDPERFTGVERTPSEVLRIGFIGSVAEFKGVHVLVDAMNRLEAREELVCRVYGKLEHFPDYAEELRSRIQNPRIELCGAYDNREVGRVLGSLDVLVVPSLWYENSPLTIHEAWLAGLPVITSRLGGMAELVEHEKSGLLFDPGDDADLARQIERLADDPGLRSRLGDCHRLVKTIEDDARDMETHYRRLLAEGVAEESGA